MKNFVFLLIVLFVLSSKAQQVTVEIGSGTSYNSPYEYPAPYGTYYKNSRHQILILASELASAGLAAGEITQIGFNVHSINTCSPMPNFKISMKHTTATQLTSSFDNTDLTVVYTTTSFLPTEGWNMHTLTTPFIWDGISNILIDICFDLISDYTENASIYYTTTSQNMVLYYFSDNNIACGTTSSSTISNKRPNIRITGQASSCLPPMNLSISNITSSTALISWNSNENNFELEYGLQGFTLGEGTLITNIQQTSYLLTNLNPSTTYDVYVRTLCNNGDTSNWVLISFKTECAEIYTFPWIETFNLPQYPPECWTRAKGLLTQNVNFSSNTSNWVKRPFANTGTNSSSSLNIYGSSIKDWLITPSINLGDGSIIYKLEFDLALTKYNSTNPPDQNGIDDKFAVVISTDNGQTWSSDNILRIWDNTGSPYVYNNISPTGEHVIISLAGYSGLIKIGFYGESTTSNADNDLFIDNIKISEFTGCETPNNIIANNISHNSAQISWSPFANENLFEIEYGLLGFTLGEGTLISNINETNYLLTGLEPNTTYQVYVRAICNDVYSDWSLPITFTTTQIPANLPYFTDFETSDGGLTIINGTQTNKWIIGTATAYSGSKSLYISNDNISNQYTTSSISVVHAYRDISFPNVAQPIYLDFYWKGKGESSFDYLRVYLINCETQPIAGSLLPTENQIGNQYYNLSSSWQLASIQLPDTIKGKTKRIVFTWRNDGSLGTQPPAAVDNINVYVLTCPKPINLTATDITDTSAIIKWEPGSNESLWELAYGLTESFNFNNANYLITSQDSIILTNLISASNYTVYVRAICSEGDTSIWSGPFTFWTKCGELMATYQQNFDLVTIPQLPNCWSSKIIASEGTPEVKTTNTTSYSSPNSVVLFNSTAIGSGNHIMLISPSFSDLPSQTTQIRFKAKISGSGTPVLYIGIMTDTSDLNSYITYQTISNLSNEWLDYTVKFDNYIGTGTFIVFKHGNFAQNQSIYIDNFIYEHIPSCPSPTQFQANQIQPTSVTLSWQPGGQENSWNIEYGITGFLPGTGTLITNITNTTYTITNLTPTLTYDFYVYAKCTDQDSSIYVGPITIKLPQQPATLPFYWNFDDEFLGWEVANGTQNNKWIVGSDTYNSPDKSAYISYNNVNNQYDITQSSIVHIYRDIQFNEGQEFMLTFTWKGIGESTYDYMRVYLIDPSITPQAGQTLSASYIGKQYYNQQPTWETDTIFLGPEYSNALKRLVFTWKNDGSMGSQPPIAIDDINIIQITCPRPADLGVGTLTTTSAEVFWNPVGPENLWQIQYGLQGFSLGSGTIITTNEYPYVITDLNSGYTYSFYVRAICGDGDTSSWAGPFTFTLPCDYYYADYIENFDSITPPNLPLCWSKIEQTTSTNAYVKTTSNTSFSSPNSVELYNSSSTGTNTNLILISPYFNDINSGITRVKFMHKANNTEKLIFGTIINPNDANTFIPLDTITSTTAWQQYVYYFSNYTGEGKFIALKHGATNTYRNIYIDNFIYEHLPQYDLKIVEISKPNIQCNLQNNEQIAIKVKNVGLNQITTFTAGYIINNQTPVIEVVNALIQPQETFEYIFNTTADLSQYITYQVKAFINLTDDLNNSNDTIEKTLNNSPLITFYPYIEDFEMDNGNWVSGGINSTWQWGTPAGNIISSAGSGSKCWVTNLTGYYNNNEESYVESPCFDFSSLVNPYVVLKYIVHAETGYDGAALQYSLDFGNTWYHVGQAGDPDNWYNDSDVNGLTFSGSNDGWTGTNNPSWKVAKHTLQNLAGNNYVKFRIVFGSDNTINSYEGFAFDNFIIFEPIDLALIYPDSTITYDCGLTENEYLTIKILNNSNYTIPENSKIYAWYKINNNQPVQDSIIITEPFMPYDTITFTFSQPANLSEIGTYNIYYWIKFQGDFDTNNDTTYSQINNIQLTVNINNPINPGSDTIAIDPQFLPFTLTLEYSLYQYDSYFWSNEDGTLTGNQHFFNAPDFGWYFVTVTFGNCSASDSILITNLTNALYLNTLNITVYPTLIQNYINIESNKAINSDVLLELNNVNGKTLYHKTYKAGHIIKDKINTSSLASGIYYLKIKNNNEIFRFKIIKK